MEKGRPLRPPFHQSALLAIAVLLIALLATIGILLFLLALSFRPLAGLLVRLLAALLVAIGLVLIGHGPSPLAPARAKEPMARNIVPSLRRTMHQLR